MADTSASTTNAGVEHSDLTPPQRIEAVLMTVDRPLGDRALAEAAGVDGVEASISELNESYESTGRIFRIVRVASGWQVMTMPESAPVLSRLHAQRQQTHLTPAAMETLSIIAYRQPVMRAEIEAIRGVACGEVLRGLLERRMIRIAGRAEELGRPMLYGTTKDFLRVFGLSGIDDLPEVEGLQRKPVRRAAPSEEEAAGTEAGDAEPAVTAEEPPATEPDAAGAEGD